MTGSLRAAHLSPGEWFRVQGSDATQVESEPLQATPHIASGELLARSKDGTPHRVKLFKLVTRCEAPADVELQKSTARHQTRKPK